MFLRSCEPQRPSGSKVRVSTGIGAHPDPPADLATRRLPLKIDRRVWKRIHAQGKSALYFGLTMMNRFDAPLGEYGVLYISADEFGSFIETFGRDAEKQYVTETDLRARGISNVSFRRPLRLVDLTSRGLRRIGADNRLTSSDHDVAQRWSFALYRHPEAPDGVLYRARTDPSRLSAAIFDRASSAVRGKWVGGLWDPDMRMVVQRILDHYGFGLVR